MKKVIFAIFLFSISSVSYSSPEDVLKEYLMFIYGKSGIQAENILYDNPDNWMIQGKENVTSIELVKGKKFNVKDPSVYSGIVGRDLVFAEIRDGKIDTIFTLQGIYSIHKQVILQFLYASLLQNKKRLDGLVTDIKNIDFGGAPAAGYGDMDVYGGILSNLPVVRSSNPVDDQISKSITYRVPLGDQGFKMRLIKDGNKWKVDTSTKLIVPLKFFFM